MRSAWPLAVVAMWGSLAAAPGASAQEPSEPARQREIGAVRGDVYLAQDGGRVTVFLVTPDGIIIGDPLDAGMAKWLHGELTAQFPDQPVRYVVHSRHDFERSGGAWVFDTTAEIVAHDRFNSELQRARPHLPASLRHLDTNGSRALDPAELAGSPLAAVVRARDMNEDGSVTFQELWSGVMNAETGYSTRRTIALGGRRLDLVHPGPAFGADLTVLHFPDERLVFAVGYALLDALPSPPRRMIASLRTIAALDFDTLIAGDGTRWSRDVVVAHLAYVEDLYEEVRVRRRAGLQLEEVQSAVSLDRHAETRSLALRTADVASVYGQLRLFTGGVYGAWQMNRLQRTDPGCVYPTLDLERLPCSGIGGGFTAPAFGARVAIGRLGAAAEISLGQTVTGAQNGYYNNVSYKLRETIIAPLFRYEVVQRRRMAVALLAGPAVVRSNLETAAVWYAYSGISFISTGGHITIVERPPDLSYPPFAYTERSTSMGRTFGADATIHLADAVRLVIPVRVDHGPRDGKWNAQAGVGVFVPFFRSVR